LDDQIVLNQWALKIPVLDTWFYGAYSKESKLLGLKKYCSTNQEDTYQNYYFGKKVSDIKEPEEFTIYRGTYRNLTSLQNQYVYSGDLSRSRS
jgi:hypothetical protein